jgi:hypothetical protein
MMPQLLLEKAPVSIFGKHPIQRERQIIDDYWGQIKTGVLFASPFSAGIAGFPLFKVARITDKERELEAQKALKAAKRKLETLWK